MVKPAGTAGSRARPVVGKPTLRRRAQFDGKRAGEEVGGVMPLYAVLTREYFRQQIMGTLRRRCP
jgi:hypothetical protein